MSSHTDRAGYALPPHYRVNASPAYFEDVPRGLVFQPHVYEMASYLVERAGLRAVVDVGAGNGEKLRPLGGRAEVMAIDHGANLARLSALGFARVLDHDVAAGMPDLPHDLLARAVVIAADIIEHLPDPGPLLDGLAHWAGKAPFVLLSTPDRVRVRGAADDGPPANPSHVREWSHDEFARALRAAGLGVGLIGHTINTDHHDVKSTLLAVAGTHADWRPSRRVPVLAIINAYNEEDIVGETVRHLLDDGIDVHVVDNWSTDGTLRVLDSMGAGGRLTVSRYPDHPSGEYEWHRLLEHTAAIAAQSPHAWVIHHDADELRASPWRGVGLADGIAFVDSLGYTAIDFTVVDFRPVGDDPVGDTWEQRVRHFEFGRRAGHFRQVKAWRQTPGVVVDLASSGGHDVTFGGRTVYPLKFLCRHYPLRSRAQAARKVFLDRAPRIARERQERGWHAHYDRFRSADDFRWDRHTLHAWSDVLFHSEFIVERLTGLGIPRTEHTDGR